ncbi:MAG TPA: ADOP family duplicated permease [Vicinamibacterales bacterium]|nr:ADOP family duplicated permease [Vicinamibacterales bacterium]
MHGFDRLIALFPREFRDAFGVEMRGVFAAQLAAARQRGRAAVCRLWMRTTPRMIGAAWREHRAARQRARPRRASRLGELRADLRLTARLLIRRPGFTAAVVAAIAIGVGAVATIFSAVNAIVLRPLPGTRDGSALVGIERRSPDMRDGASASYLLYAQIRDRARSLDGAAAWSRVALAIRPDARDGASIAGAIVSSNYFAVLGVQPFRGRFFDVLDDTRPLAEPEIVVSFDLWQRQLDADAAAVGRRVHVNGARYRIVGVAPPGFRGVFTPLKIDAWVPLSTQPHVRPQRDLTHAPWLWVFGRLRADRDRARAELTDLFSSWAQTSPESAVIRAYTSARLTPLTGLPDDARVAILSFSGVLMGAAMLVLLIAGANASSLLAARAISRRRELNIRAALGASRGRLIRQLLTETLVLFGLGAGGGLAVAWAGTAALERVPLPGDAALALELSPDARVVTFAIVVALAVGVLFGIGPALRGTKRHLSAAMRDGSAGATRRSRITHLLIVGQLAASMVLLATAALFARALDRGAVTDLGFNPAGVLSLRVNTESFGYDDARAAAFLTTLRERVTTIPGVTASAYASLLPLAETPANVTVTPRAAVLTSPTELRVFTAGVGDGYFETLQIPLVAGRSFSTTEIANTADVAVVSETLSRRAWPGAAAVGSVLRVGSRAITVVGVARDTKHVSLDEPPAAFLYRPIALARPSAVTLLVRTQDRPAAAAMAVAAAMRAIDPTLPRPAVTAFADDVGHALLPQRVAAVVTGILGAGGLTLAAIGLYGALAFAVGARTRELGVRRALGAREFDVVALVAWQGLRLAGAGIAIGLGLAFVATRALDAYLLGVSPLDPIALSAAAGIFIVVALAATVIPARRAARADPIGALRSN